MAGLVIKLVLIVEAILDKFVNIEAVNALATFNADSGQWEAAAGTPTLLTDALPFLTPGGVQLSQGLGQIIEQVVAMIQKISILMPL